MLSIKPLPAADRESQVNDRGTKYLINSFREKQNLCAWPAGPIGPAVLRSAVGFGATS